MDDLDPEARARCEAALVYIEDMSAWYDEDVEEAPRLDYARRILAEIARRGDLGDVESAWCAARLEERYGTR